MTYEYDCLNCDTAVVVERSIHDKEETPICESCGYRMRRVYDAPGIHLKGSGWASGGGAK